MNAYKLVPAATFVTSLCNCIAYEAIRINGWYNRFSYNGCCDFNEIAFSKWGEESLLVYALIFMSFVVVICNKNAKVRYGWFLFSLIMLVISLTQIPEAMLGRYISTSDKFLLFYLFVVPIPSIAFIIYGLTAGRKGKHNSS